MKSVSTDSSCSSSSTRVPEGPPTKAGWRSPAGPRGSAPAPTLMPLPPATVRLSTARWRRPQSEVRHRDGPVDRRVQRHRQDHFCSNPLFPVGFGGWTAREESLRSVIAHPATARRTRCSPIHPRALVEAARRRGWSELATKGTVPAFSPATLTVAVAQLWRRGGSARTPWRGASTVTSVCWPSRIATFSAWPTTSGSSPPE